MRDFTGRAIIGRSVSAPKRQSRLVLSALGVSAAAHVILLAALDRILATREPPEPLRLSYRVVGREGGERMFTMRLPRDRPDPAPDLANLAPLEEAVRRMRLPEPSAQTAPDDEQTRELSRRERRLVLESLGLSPADAAELGFSELDLRFSPPEGVDEDELNSAEKRFYGFQRRVFLAYAMSFLATWRRMSMERPRLRESLAGQRRVLAGSLRFDGDGARTDLAVAGSGDGGSARELFRRTLERMRTIPNPPEELVGADGFFTIHYRLGIN